VRRGGGRRNNRSETEGDLGLMLNSKERKRVVTPGKKVSEEEQTGTRRKKWNMRCGVRWSKMGGNDKRASMGWG